MSVAASIAAGAKRLSSKDYERFLAVAEGSLAETQYLLMLSRNLGLAQSGDSDSLLKDAEAIARRLHKLRVRVAGSRLQR